MRVTIREIEVQGKQEVFSDRVVETDRLTIGRGTDQHIELADLRVALAHAWIVQRSAGAFVVESVGQAAVWRKGSPVHSAPLRFDDEVEIGRFRLTLRRPPEGGDLLIECRERISVREERSRRQQAYVTELGQTGLTLRRLGWLLFLGTLLLGLALPAATRYWPSHRDTLPQADAAMWNPGPVAASHMFFAADCGRCHEKPFVPVRNAACLDCHKSQPHHSADPKILQTADFAGMRCESCHHEHMGPAGLIAAHPAQCTGCHARPARRFADARLQAAGDFGNAHPDFSPALARFDPGQGFRYVEFDQREARSLWENHNLKFPHDVHLVAGGVKTPAGLKVLHCSSCHQPDGGGIGFIPITMQRHCADCHQLTFDPDEPQRALPHGNAEAATAAIRDAYANKALSGGVASDKAPPVVRMIRIPGKPLSQAERKLALAWAQAQSSLVIDEVFDRRLCVSCHVVQATEDRRSPWRVLPVVVDHLYFRQARFSHRAHRSETCESCHQAQNSHDSREVLMPTLTQCRECHGGARATRRVASTCIACHGFHTAQQASFGQAAAGP